MKAKRHFGKSALRIVTRYFPQVNSVNDAQRPIIVEVTSDDVEQSKVKDHLTCALAVACKRAFKADGVIIGLTRSYIIKGFTATRYQNAETISREVITFDRFGKSGFDTGYYALSPVCPSSKLGNPHRSGASGKKNPKSKPRFRHFTSGVRTVLGR